jgi:membrane protease YdiL (CAAX protease family)
VAQITLLFIALVILRLILFGLALGLTLISFQAYRQKQTQQLEYAFIGFAFISMGMAMTNLTIQVAESRQSMMLLQLVETLPFIVGFAMLYVSLYE